MILSTTLAPTVTLQALLIFKAAFCYYITSFGCMASLSAYFAKAAVI